MLVVLLYLLSCEVSSIFYFLPHDFFIPEREMEIMVVAIHSAVGLLPGQSSYRDEIDHDPHGFQTENAVEFRDRYFGLRKPGAGKSITDKSMNSRKRQHEKYGIPMKSLPSYIAHRAITLSNSNKKVKERNNQN